MLANEKALQRKKHTKKTDLGVISRHRWLHHGREKGCSYLGQASTVNCVYIYACMCVYMHVCTVPGPAVTSKTLGGKLAPRSWTLVIESQFWSEGHADIRGGGALAPIEASLILKQEMEF